MQCSASAQKGTSLVIPDHDIAAREDRAVSEPPAPRPPLSHDCDTRSPLPSTDVAARGATSQSDRLCRDPPSANAGSAE
jgi:hypothetical protein